MITLKELKHNYYSKEMNEDIRNFVAWIIVDRWLLQNKHKLFYNEVEKQSLDTFRVIDDQMFMKYKAKEYKLFRFEPDRWVIREFFNNQPFTIELPINTAEDRKQIWYKEITKWFLWPLAKERIIDDLLFTVLKNLVSLLWIYYSVSTRTIWFWHKQLRSVVKAQNKMVTYSVKEYSLEEVLFAEITQWYVNHTVWDSEREYWYTHLLRQHAKFRLFNWSKNVLMGWDKYNVLATSRWYWKTMLASFIASRWLLDERPWFWWRNYREIKYFVPDKENIWNQVMEYIKSMIWNLANIKLENWKKAFEFWKFSVKCNITWNYFKIISLHNYWQDWWELWSSRWEWIACDLAIIDEAARIPDAFWTSFHQRAAFETENFFIVSTINKETPADHWFYRLIIDWESWEDWVKSYRFDIEMNEVMRFWKTKEERNTQLEKVKEELRKWWDKELYAKWYCIILEESNVFNIWNNIITSNSSKYKDDDVRILWFDLGKLTDTAWLVLINLTHREIESAIPVLNATYWTQLDYAEDYKKRYKNLFIIWDRSWVWEAVSEQDIKWVVDAWIKSTWQGSLNYNRKNWYYTCNKWTIVTTLATVLNSNLIRIPSHNDALIEQLNNFVKMKSWRWEVILYKWKWKSKDDLVLATAYAILYMYSILWMKTLKDIEDYVKQVWNTYAYSYNDQEEYWNQYYNSLY